MTDSTLIRKLPAFMMLNSSIQSSLQQVTRHYPKQRNLSEVLSFHNIVGYIFCGEGLLAPPKLQPEGLPLYHLSMLLI